MGGERSSALAAALVMMVVAAATTAEAKVYHLTWSLPADSEFNVTYGDIVVFRFDAILLNLMKVDKWSFKYCKMHKATAIVIQKRTNQAPHVAVGPEILQPGSHYFVCGVTNLCDLGMKTQINVN
ncbi:uclacyanin 1 [Striga hermonthica]|uniref:Uclacyanin 1 n=1 Tax=Striga hermonthica TaxID=68872 RepID=A0A9N7NVI3_STRHE|nr:uclacyanin 1 [Striga hermonthica]